MTTGDDLLILSPSTCVFALPAKRKIYKGFHRITANIATTLYKIKCRSDTIGTIKRKTLKLIVNAITWGTRSVHTNPSPFYPWHLIVLNSLGSTSNIHHVKEKPQKTAGFLSIFVQKDSWDVLDLGHPNFHPHSHPSIQGCNLAPRLFHRSLLGSGDERFRLIFLKQETTSSKHFVFKFKGGGGEGGGRDSGFGVIRFVSVFCIPVSTPVFQFSLPYKQVCCINKRWELCDWRNLWVTKWVRLTEFNH